MTSSNSVFRQKYFVSDLKFMVFLLLEVKSHYLIEWTRRFLTDISLISPSFCATLCIVSWRAKLRVFLHSHRDCLYTCMQLDICPTFDIVAVVWRFVFFYGNVLSRFYLDSFTNSDIKFWLYPINSYPYFDWRNLFDQILSPRLYMVSVFALQGGNKHS